MQIAHVRCLLAAARVCRGCVDARLDAAARQSCLSVLHRVAGGWPRAFVAHLLPALPQLQALSQLEPRLEPLLSLFAAPAARALHAGELHAGELSGHIRAYFSTHQPVAARAQALLAARVAQRLRAVHSSVRITADGVVGSFRLQGAPDWAALARQTNVSLRAPGDPNAAKYFQPQDVSGLLGLLARVDMEAHLRLSACEQLWALLSDARFETVRARPPHTHTHAPCNMQREEASGSVRVLVRCSAPRPLSTRWSPS
jgi:hypothetical protein